MYSRGRGGASHAHPLEKALENRIKHINKSNTIVLKKFRL